MIKSWTRKPVAPKRTAKVARPVISPAGTNRSGVSVSISHRYADGRWGPGHHGWKYKTQFRAVGAKKWRGATTMTMSKPGPFDFPVRTPGGARDRAARGSGCG